MDRRSCAAFAAVLLALSLAGIAAAKDGPLASLEAPIPPDSDPGTKIDVAWRAWMPDSGPDWPFSGSPVFIRLVSANGGRSTETIGRESPRASGHYEATISVPSGGIGRVEVGLFGESCVNGNCTRSDLLFTLPAEQAHPQLAAPLAQAPRVKAPEPVARYNAQPQAAPPTTANPPIDGVTMALGAIALAGLGVVAFVVLRSRRPFVRRGLDARG